jgi:hypothetical protein
MRNRPKPVLLLAAFIWSITIAIPLQIAFSYNYSFEDWQAFWLNISQFNKLIVVLGFLAGALIFQGSKWALGALSLFSILIFWNNYFVGSFGLDHSLTVTTISSIAFAIITATILSLGAFRILIDSSSKPWKIQKRLQVQRPVQITPILGKSFEASTFDISASGVFVESTKRLKVGEIVDLQILINERDVIACSAKVIRKANGKDRYPHGFGMHFEYIEPQDRQKLQSL